MSLMLLLSILLLLLAFGWLARARRLRRERRTRVREVLLQANVGGDRFNVNTIDCLPVPAALYLSRALSPDALLARSVDIRMNGSLRVSGAEWVPFEARQRICGERGFIWEARIAVLRRLATQGADWLFGDQAGNEYALADWWPVLQRHGRETQRSAAGRHMVDLIWLPSALTPQRGAQWARGDEDRAVVTPSGSKTPMTITVGPDGRLREASIVRRRVSANGETSIAAYGVSIESEQRWGDYVVPERLVFAWGIGTDDREDFMRLTVDEIRWL